MSTPNVRTADALEAAAALGLAAAERRE